MIELALDFKFQKIRLNFNFEDKDELYNNLKKVSDFLYFYKPETNPYNVDLLHDLICNYYNKIIKKLKGNFYENVHRMVIPVDLESKVQYNKINVLFNIYSYANIIKNDDGEYEINDFRIDNSNMTNDKKINAYEALLTVERIVYDIENKG